MNKIISKHFDLATGAIIVLSVLMQHVYCNFADDSPEWWMFDKAVDRVTYIAYLGIICKMASSMVVKFISIATSFYFLVQLSFEYQFIFDQFVNVQMYHNLLLLYTVAVVVLSIIANVSRIR
jgi:hypothetical protein